MVLSCPVGQPFIFTLRIRSGFESLSSSGGSIRFSRTEKTASVSIKKHEFTVTKKTLEIAWNATGLAEDELAGFVGYEISLGDEIVSSGVVRVYREEIEVQVEDENGDSLDAISCEVYYRPDSDFTAQYDIELPMTRECKVVNGRMLVPYYPGELRYKWLGTYQPKERTEPTPKPAREVVLYPQSIDIELICPVARSRRRQWVNEPSQSQRIHLGSSLVIEVQGVVPGTKRLGGAGTVVYVKVARIKSSGRNDSDGPKLRGEAIGTGESRVVKLTLGPDHKATVDFHAGHGGGDVFEISTGTTSDCLASFAKITTWRKLYLDIFLAEGYEMLVGVGAVERLLSRAFETSFIQPVIRVKESGRISSHSLKKVPLELIRKIGIPWKKKAMYSICEIEKKDGYLGSGKKPEGAIANASIDGEDRERCVLRCLVVDLIMWKVRRSFSCQFRGTRHSAALKVSEVEGCVLPRTFDDEYPLCKFDAGNYGSWERRGVSGRVTDKELSVSLKGNAVIFGIDLSREIHPSRLSPEPVRVSLSFFFYKTPGGSASGREFSVAWPETGSEAEVAHKIAHEIGHCLGQAVMMKSPAEYPGDFEDEKNENSHDGRGFIGDHCRSGLADKYVGKQNYASLSKKKVHGGCVMWGGIFPGFDYENASRFCECCAKFLRVRKMGPVAGSFLPGIPLDVDG